MKKNNTSENKIPEKDSKVFAETVLNPEIGSYLYNKLIKLFFSEMDKAISGKICTPERMAVLYPIFREINIETDEISADEINIYEDEAEMKPADLIIIDDSLQKLKTILRLINNPQTALKYHTQLKKLVEIFEEKWNLTEWAEFIDA